MAQSAYFKLYSFQSNFMTVQQKNPVHSMQLDLEGEISGAIAILELQGCCNCLEGILQRN